MKVTCIAGSKLQVILVAEGPVEAAFLSEMSLKSTRGEKTTLTSVESEQQVSQHVLEVG